MLPIANRRNNKDDKTIENSPDKNVETMLVAGICNSGREIEISINTQVNFPFAIG